jgi:hypothetical protein
MTIDLEELRQKKAFEELQAKEANQPSSSTPVITAFLVVQDKSGQWLAFHDYDNHDIEPDRAASLDDMIGGCSAVISGCQVHQTAMSTVMMMQQQAQAMQQQMLQQQQAQKAASLIDPSKLRNPNA